MMKAGVALEEADLACRKVMLGMLGDMGLVHGDMEGMLAKKIDRWVGGAPGYPTLARGKGGGGRLQSFYSSMVYSSIVLYISIVYASYTRGVISIVLRPPLLDIEACTRDNAVPLSHPAICSLHSAP